MFKRVIIKISGEALAIEGKGYNNDLIEEIVKDINKAILKGTQISLVIGGGNYWRGRSSSVEMDRTKADQIGMLATVMNAIYLCDSFRREGIPSKVMTPFKIGTMTKEFTKEEALDIMKDGGVPIFAGGLGHPFFSTDTITSLRGAELNCDCILYAKNIDGIYDADPMVNKEAKKYKTITYREIIKDNLKAIDVTAMQISEEAKVTSLVFALNGKGNISKACENNEAIYKISTKITI